MRAALNETPDLNEVNLVQPKQLDVIENPDPEDDDIVSLGQYNPLNDNRSLLEDLDAGELELFWLESTRGMVIIDSYK